LSRVTVRLSAIRSPISESRIALASTTVCAPSELARSMPVPAPMIVLLRIIQFDVVLAVEMPVA
jgi:hypothetical protein